MNVVMRELIISGLKSINKVQTKNDIRVRIKMTVAWQIELLISTKPKNVLENLLKN